MSGNAKKLGVVNVERKRWNLDEYEAIAAANAAAGGDDAVSESEAKRRKLASAMVVKGALQRREGDQSSIYNSKVGQHQIVTATTPAAQGAGFYCATCAVTLKDNMQWLNHINGQKHAKLLGMTMQTERATLSKVKQRLQHHKQLDEEKQLSGDVDGGSSASSVQQRLSQLDQQLSKLKQEQQRSENNDHRNNNSNSNGAEEGADDDDDADAPSSSSYHVTADAVADDATREDTAEEKAMMAAMGFGTFGGGNSSSSSNKKRR